MPRQTGSTYRATTLRAPSLRYGTGSIAGNDMDAGLATLLAAVVTGVFGVVIVSIQQLRKSNESDHAVVSKQLRFIMGQVARVDKKIDNHTERHEEEHGRTTITNTVSRGDE